MSSSRDNEDFNDYLASTLKSYFGNVHTAAENQFERSLWQSWGFGAVSLLKGIQVLEEFVARTPSKDEVHHLLEISIQPMISIWCHNWEKQGKTKEQEKLIVRDTAYRNVQLFLARNSEDDIVLSLNLDKELQRYLDEQVDSTAYYIGLFHVRYQECIDKTSIVEWNRLTFPIESWEQVMDVLNKENYRYLSMESSLMVWQAIAESAKIMFEEFQRNFKK